MERERQRIYHAKVDTSGRIVLPTEVRERSHIAEGDTVVLVQDASGLHVRSFEQSLADAQAYFARLAPADVCLSDEIIADRRSEIERD